MNNGNYYLLKNGSGTRERVGELNGVVKKRDKEKFRGRGVGIGA